MGWLWSDSNSKTQIPNAALPNSINAFEPKITTSSPAILPAAKSHPNNGKIEFQDILNEFQSPPPLSSPQTSNPSPSSTETSSDLPPQQEWKPSFLYPTTISSVSAFDQAMHCQLLSGQFTNYYRHGTLRDCSELWSNFWFCMRTNRGFMSARERERRVQTFYRAREARLRSEGSSEDVWEARAEEDIVEWAEGQCKFDRNEWEQSGTLLVRKGS